MRLFVLLGVLAGCGGPPNVGAYCSAGSGCDDGLTCDVRVLNGYCTKACSVAGSTNSCPEGAVCDTLAGGPLSCLKICKDSVADCRSDQECNGVSASNLKACHPK